MKIKTIITFLAIVFFNLSAIGVTNAAKVDKLKFDFCTYMGEVKRGKALGHGALSCEDGTNYIGQFKRNIINGDGILILLPPEIDSSWLEENPFPIISEREEIKRIIEEIVKKMVDFEDVDNVLTEEGQERMRELQKQMKLIFFRSPGMRNWYDATLENYIENGFMTEEEFIDNLKIFAGRWKWGKFVEYFDPNKKFRRVVKLNKLEDIGGEREGNQDGDGNQAIQNAANLANAGIGNAGNVGDAIDGGGVIPGDGEDGEVKDGGVKVGVDGTTRTAKIDFGGGITYEGDVDKDGIPNGKGTFTNNNNGDTYTGEVKNGAPGGKGKVAFGDDGGVIEGTWDKDGGKGTYTNEKTGDEYKGEFAFENGEDGPEINPVGTGKGSYTDPETGITREGTFVDGDLVDGTISNKDGEIVRGIFGPGENIVNGIATFNGDVITFQNGKITEINNDKVTFDEKGVLVELNGEPVVPEGAVAAEPEPTTNALVEDATLEMQGKGNKYYEAKTDIDEPAENINPVDLAAAASSATNKDASGSNTGSNAAGSFSMTEAGQQAEKDGGSGSGEKGSDGGGEGEGDGGGSM